MSIDERFNSDLSQLEELKDKNDYKPFYGQIIEQEVGRRSTLHKELRSYEVSLWTLQDEFITVLKWSDVEQQDRIRDPQMKLNVDGTQTFTFSIPMYLYVEVPDSVSEHIVRIEKRENPIWYNTQNGNLMVGLRKIKVIFNKYDKSSEQVFEFLITKVTESHEQDQLTCNIECEGLAFHELGKIGYKISLSQDTYTLDKKDYDETGMWTKYDGTPDDNEPIENVQYWAEHCGLVPWPSNGYINPTVWYYTIEMNWGSFGSGRASDKVYDDEYISSWTEQSGTLIAGDVHEARERARPISVSESNIYNITQTIAETFKIYCRYEYGYDDNYHINSRKVVFYNNYLNENNVVSFTYPYATKSITREMDSTDVVTKMYVRPQDDTSVVSGKINIDTCPANKSKEDYLLNFDYLYANKLINKEQYDEIAEYEKKMRQFNTTLDDLSLRLAAYEDELTTQKAKVTLYSNAKDLDQEQIDYNSALYNRLTAEGNGYIRRTATNPYSTYIKKDKKGQYYIKLSDEDKGIDPTANNILIFRIYNSAKQTFKNRITNFTVITDTDGVNKFASKIILSPFQESFNIDRQQKTVNLKDPIEGNEANIWDVGNGDLDDPMNDNSSTSLLVYLVYQYKPILYYEEVNKVWLSKQAEDEKNYLEALEAVGPESINDENFDFETVFNDYVATSTMSFSTNDYNELQDPELSDFKSVVYNAGIHSKIKIVENSITENLTAKKTTINKFNAMMGPALREGFWQPDSYNDYGDKKSITTTLKFSGPNDNSYLNDTNDFILPGKITDNNMKIGWDATLFDGEDKTYYEYGIIKDHLYYPCIVLKDLNLLKTIRRWLKNSRRPSLVFNNNYYKTLNNSDEINDRQNMEVFTLGGGLEFGYVCKKPNNEHRYVYPALIVTGAKDMTDDEIVFMMTRADQKGNPRLALVETKINSDGTPVTKFIPDNGNNNYGIALNASDFYWYTGKYPDLQDKPHSNNDFNIVYPSLKCSSTELNTNSIIIKYNGILLSNYIDYQILSRSQNQESNDPPIKRSYFEYIIRINPETVMKFSAFPQEAQAIYEQNFEVKYVVSNASTAIYLDALEVMLESSKPKASYTVDVNVLDQHYLSTLYKDLAQLVMINDNELKFQNTFGYISGLELNLDKPQEDKIEVKNYKTKFEDLFSTIVAQTEEMKKNGELLGAIANGQVPLGETAFQTTVDSNWSAMQAYIDAGFDSSEVVKNRLAEIFAEASMILSASQQSLRAIRDLNIKNAEILAGFVENIAADLTPNVVTSKIQPTDFKVGDIWNQVDDDGNIIGRYVATSNSEGGSGGYTRTFDGSLASITGAAMNIDAVAGTVEILAQNRIDLKSGKHIYIAAGDTVDIVGNKSVNIGGGSINIAGSANDNINAGGVHIVSSKINFKNSDAAIESEMRNKIGDATISKVLIDSGKVELGGANIIMKGANRIQMKVSRDTVQTTSAIDISPENGIYIGSGAGVNIYSGAVNVQDNNDGTFTITGGASSVQLLPSHLLMGVSNLGSNNNTVIKMTSDYVIIGAGGQFANTNYSAWQKNHSYTVNTIVSYNNTLYKCKEAHISEDSLNPTKWDMYDPDANLVVSGKGGNRGLIGAQFTSNSIGFATQSASNGTTTVNAILMNDNGVVIASDKGAGIDLTQATKESLKTYYESGTSGSYVRVASDGIELGSMADLYINTDNFKLQTHSRDKGNNPDFIDGETIMAVGSNLQRIDYDTQIVNGVLKDKDGNDFTGNNIPNVRLLVNKNGLYISGTVYASAGSFTGYVTATGFILRGSAISDFNSAITSSTAYSNIPDNIEKLYYLTTSATAPGKPATKVTTSSTSNLNTWSLTMPEYPSGNTLYYYYTCIQTTQPNGTTTWSTPVRESQATAASTITEQFKANGLLSNYSWGGHTFPIALTSEGTLLIGANSGIWIAKPSSSSYSDGAAVTIDKTGIALAGSTISLNAASTISIVSGATINIDSTNFSVHSAPADGQRYFYAGNGLDGDSEKCIKYTRTGNLVVKGDITATSFTLSGNAVTQFNTAVANSGFTVDGVSIQSWNGGNYVALTQSSDSYNGVLVGTSDVDKHFIIPRSSSKTAVDICKSYIKFDYNNNTHIYLTSDGIEVTGKRISIGGQDVWARDDIIILKKSSADGYESQDDIETRMSSSHDWVLIKPYYDAKFNFYYTNVFSLYDDTPATVAMISNSSNPYFGTITSGKPYHYTIKCKLHLPTASQGIQLLLYAQNKNDSSNTRSRNPVSGNCTIASDVISASDITIDNNGYISFNSARVQTLTITLNSSSTNLCEEGYSIYIKATARNATNANSVTIHELQLICETDTVAGRVPCTVYYYP